MILKCSENERGLGLLSCRLKLPALHKCRVDRLLEELFAASPEGPKRGFLSELNRKAIPKNCSRISETIFHLVCMGKGYSEFVSLKE